MVSVLAAVNLCVALLVGVTLAQGRRHAQEAAATTAHNLTLALVRGLTGDLQRIDLALFALRQELAHERNSGGVRPGVVNAYIDRLFSQFPELSSIRIATADGRIAYGIGVAPGSTYSIQDRAYFKEARDNPRTGLLISEPVIGKISGQRVVILARRDEDAAGRFAGVVYAAVTVEQLTRSMSLIDVGRHGAAALRAADLSVLVRYPATAENAAFVGRKDSSPALQALVAEGRTTAVYTARGGLDGIERTFAYMKVGAHPLSVVVGLASDDYLAKWRSDAWRLGSFFAVFLALTSGLAWLLHRAWARERQRTGEELRRLRGLLPICATCKKIRDDAGYWNQLEGYIQDHSEAHFTHGICPDCATRLREEFERL